LVAERAAEDRVGMAGALGMCSCQLPVGFHPPSRVQSFIDCTPATTKGLKMQSYVPYYLECSFMCPFTHSHKQNGYYHRWLLCALNILRVAHVSINYIEPVVLNGATLQIFTMSGGIFDCCVWGRGCQLASSEYRPGMMDSPHIKELCPQYINSTEFDEA
jgi:hypothetical protein